MTQAAHGTLILVCGLPGSGKTTFAKNLALHRRAIRLSPDEWIEAILADRTDTAERDRLRDPVENLQWELAQGYLNMGFTVILENGFWAEEERSLYAVGAIELGARIELVYMEAPNLDKLWERVLARNAAIAPAVFVMTAAEFWDACAIFEAPQPDEMSYYDECAVITWDDQSVQRSAHNPKH
ncbi:MAG: AAA family ATPase [Fimbriimonadaceae bacterium]